MKLKLTPTVIAQNLVCPDGVRRVELCDTEVPGLYIEVRATSPGQGTFYLRYKNRADKTAHSKIGRTTDVSLPEARRKAKTLRAEIALGADPRGELKAERAVMSYSDFFESHYLPHVRPRKRSWSRDEELYRLRIKKRFGHLRLNAIERQSIQIFHSDLRAEGLAPATCDHHLKLLRQSLNLAVDWAMLEKNPASRLRLFHADNKVENLLDETKLGHLLTVLRTDPNRTVCLIALFLLSTGARLNEVLRARWDQIDLAHRVWRIPASNSKSKRVRSVPLNDSAVAVLAQLTTQGAYQHLFVNEARSVKDKKEQPYTTVMKVWDRLRTKANLPKLRIHDLRHQFASLLVNGGRSLYEVQQILGHSSPGVTQRYAHLSNQRLQEAANTASLAINVAGAAAKEAVIGE